jgi:chromosome segregation ATPase
VTKARNLTLILPLLIGIGLTAGTAQAKIKCWTNSDGIRECGNIVPPEYAQQGHDEFSKQGTRIKHHERAQTEAELAETARLKAIEDEKKRLAEEQAMHDRVLLNTFASEDEIIMARDGKITSIKTEIRLTNRSMDVAKERLNQLRKKAANLERAGKPVSKKLSQDIQHTQTQIEEYEKFVNSRQAEKDKIHQQFETDVTRYRTLRPQRRVQ